MNPIVPRHRLLSFALLACTSALVAQDPPPPPGGFPIVEILDRNISWSDAYRTRMDLYRPNVAAPATGWPGVLAIHGGAENRKTALIRGLSRYLAARGYVVYAYDVSGDGDTIALNPGWPTPRGEDRVLLDSAESHGVAQGLLPGFIDPTRLAVTGNSQGGIHSLQAAGWSGRALPLAGRVATYPVVRAVAPEIASVDSINESLPGGVLIDDEFIEGRAPTDPLVVMLDVEDYPGIVAWAAGQLTAQIRSQVATSTVPILAMYAWQDQKHRLNASVDAFATMTMPHRLFLTTGGHSTPFNGIERALEQDLRGRWFDRFLKNVNNGVDVEAYAELAVEPDQPAWGNTASVWEHRRTTQWPPALAGTTFHLRGNRSLTTAAPAAPEVGPTIQHRVAAGFTPAAYVAQGSGGNPGLLYPQMTPMTRPFETAPLAEPMEVFGRVTVDLAVGDTTGTFQLSAELTHVDAGGTSHYIAFGTGGRRGGAAGQGRLTFDLCDTVHVVPAGHFLRLTIMNLADQRAPNYHKIRFVPYFTDTNTTVLMQPGALSRVHVPLRPYQANLTPRLAQASVAAGVNHGMTVNGGPARAGFLSLTLMGASGEAPGLPLPGLPAPLPVNFDAWSQLGLSILGTPMVADFVAVLNASGRANPTLSVPPGAAAALLGLRFTFGGVIIDPALAFDSVVGPVTLIVDP